MRIWSKALIEVLPQKQLMAMRYELGDIIKQYPNIKHGLVKFANKYDIAYLYGYFDKVCNECLFRNIKMNFSYNKEILDIVYYSNSRLPIINDCVFEEDNEEYLKICLMNLYEKFIRNMITKEEWQKIEDKFGDVLND